MIKKILISLAFISICASSFAQTEVRIRVKKPIEPYHNFTLGVGFFPIMGGAIAMLMGHDDYGYRDYDQSRMYQNGAINLPAFNLGYNYDVLRWLSVGGVVSYSYTGAKYYDGLSGAKIGNFGISNLSLTAMVRFTWLRRPVVRLYSQLGLGMGFFVQSKTLLGDSQVSEAHATISGQVAYFGIQLGRKVYGFAELAGLGSQGAIVVGVGYRFLDKKR